MSYKLEYIQKSFDESPIIKTSESDKNYSSEVRNKIGNVNRFDLKSNDELTIVSSEDLNWFLNSEGQSSFYADLIFNNAVMTLSGHSEGTVDIANSILTSRLLGKSSMDYTLKNDSSLISRIGGNATSEINLDASILTLTAYGNSVTDVCSYGGYLEIEAKTHAEVNVYARGDTNIDFSCVDYATVNIEQYGLKGEVHDITPVPDNVLRSYPEPISVDAGIGICSIGAGVRTPAEVVALLQ